MSAVPYTFATDSGNIPLSQLDANFANVKAFADTAGYVTQGAQANITSVGILTSASIAGNVTGGNILTAGNVTGGNILTAGNVSGNYILGNGALLSGVVVSATNISNGTSSVAIPVADFSVAVSVGGIANIALFTPNGQYLTGFIEASGVANIAGNVRGANFNTTGLITATGNILSDAGIKSSSKTTGIGYSTGAGNIVTQGTNRSTGVTINAVSGAITLYSVAGNTTYTTFTVTNSAVANTDVIIVNQRSGADKYEAFVSNVATGSFAITVSDATGTTTEAPVLNFAVIKAVTA